MSDKYLNRIIKKSSEMRHVDKSQTRTESIKTPVDIHSFKTFRAMKNEREESKASILIWSVIYAICFLALFYLFISAGTGFYHGYLRMLFIILSALCLFRIFYYHLQSIITYPLYKNWIRRMPFAVTGWSNLFDYDGYYDHEMWINKCTLTISRKSCSDYHRKALQSSLSLFCNGANRTFAKYHDDNLTAWENNSDSISGSCNREITGKLYRYITNDLRKIHGITGIIESVNIRIDNIVVNAGEIETANSAAST